MGYFDAITNGSFKRIEDGRTAFYPWGVLGTGYILTDDAKYREVRGFVKKYYLICLPSILACGFLVGWLNVFFLLPVLMGAYFFMVRRHLTGLSRAPGRLALGESYRLQAAGHSLALLWVFEVTSVLFALLGLLIMTGERGAPLLGLAITAFFGLCAVAIGYMIRAKRNGKSSQSTG